MLQPDGPLRGLAIVAEASSDGSFSDPQLAFTTDDTQVTAVVGLGDDIQEGSTLTIVWYRLVGVDGRERLFSHEIAVGPGGQAFSQGVAEGGLAPGLYETVATLGERQVRTPWVVRIGTDAASPGGAAGAFALLSPSGLAQAGDEDWNVPESGDSGWYDPETTPASPPPPGPCEVDQVFTGFNPLTTVDASVSWVGRCSHMALAATVSGPPQEIASREIGEGSLAFLPAEAEVCELPGGSDLPGTVVRWSATGSEGASGSSSFTLPDFGETLEAIAQSVPEAPTRVEAGDRIVLRGMAMVMPPALGIEELSLYAGDELINKVGNASGTDAPQPCDFGRYGAVNRTSYTVPEGPPPVIEICAEAIGFDGTESRNCIEFYTGEVWKGTTTIDNRGVCTAHWNVTLRVDDGEVSGDIEVVSDSCGGAISGDVTGTKTEQSFTLMGPVSGPTVTIPITGGNRAHTLLHPHPITDETWDLECESCEE